MITPRHDSRENIGFGEFLRHARERRGLTIQQVSSETKIPPRLLDALEHGRLFEAPGRTYQRGEVIAYAKAVGLDRGVALARLEQALQTIQSEPQAAPDAQAAARRRTGLRPFLLIGVIGAAMVVAMTWPPVPFSWNDKAAAARGGSDGPAAGAAALPRAQARGAATDVASKDVSSVDPAQGSAGESRAVSANQAIAGNAGAAQIPSETSEAPSTQADLVIVSTPPGARVTIDGIGWGTTPVRIRYLPPGVKRIRVTKDGYSAEDVIVQLAAETATVTIPLRRTP